VAPFQREIAENGRRLDRRYGCVAKVRRVTRDDEVQTGEMGAGNLHVVLDIVAGQRQGRLEHNAIHRQQSKLAEEGVPACK
jgi:hypothetical protein